MQTAFPLLQNSCILKTTNNNQNRGKYSTISSLNEGSPSSEVYLNHLFIIRGSPSSEFCFSHLFFEQRKSLFGGLSQSSLLWTEKSLFRVLSQLSLLWMKEVRLQSSISTFSSLNRGSPSSEFYLNHLFMNRGSPSSEVHVSRMPKWHSTKTR